MTKMNIPNRLTIIRILLVPVVVAVYLCMDPTICVIDETSGLALRDVIAFVIFSRFATMCAAQKVVTQSLALLKWMN